MCLIAIAYRTHSDFPVIITANRDEFYNRPTAPLDFWEDDPRILAGRDLEGRGTWLGVTKNGRIAAVTNFREPHFKSGDRRSRGFLVSEFLSGNDTPDKYLSRISAEKNLYNGFNLIVGTPHEIWWFSNKGGDITRLSPGIHAISNHLLDTPWPKVEITKKRLGELIEADDISPEKIFRYILSDGTRPPDHKLPDTGIGLEWERRLSSPFVISDIYGTRSSSVITVDNNCILDFWERTTDPPSTKTVGIKTRRFNFKLE